MRRKRNGLTLSSGKKKKPQTTQNAATDPKIQPMLTPIDGLSNIGAQRPIQSA